jgi:precorrin-6A/cobalt-precorrin-6A reductase
MILLLGGTSETATIAERLACAGFEVLVSTATKTALNVGVHPRIRRRCGKLDAEAMERLVRDRKVRAIVDAAHPYAERLRAQARTVAERVPTPYFRYVRPDALRDRDKTDETITLAADHAAAAAIAFSFGKPVLLTTGSNNLEPYRREAAQRRVPMAVRVLPERESLEACRRAGIEDAWIISERGPFSRQQNRDHIRRFCAGVLVTKESGVEGGFLAKREAARAERCRLVVIQRPPEPATNAYGTVDTLIAAVKKRLSHS